MRLGHPSFGLDFVKAFKVVDFALSLLLWIIALNIMSFSSEWCSHLFINLKTSTMNFVLAFFFFKSTAFFVNWRNMVVKIVIFVSSSHMFRTRYCKIIFYGYLILTRCFNIQYFWVSFEFPQVLLLVWQVLRRSWSQSPYTRDF